jgi:AAA15 family ATPase/GTPase
MSDLLKFSIKNFRSFYTEQSLSFGVDAARPVTAIFGPNASGKSNTAKALSVIKEFIINSADANSRLPYFPFALRTGAAKEPSKFTIIFEQSGRQFNYSFAFNKEQVVHEKLSEKSMNTSKMRLIFERDANGDLSPSADKHGFGKTLRQRTRKETLLITKAREDNNQYSNTVFEFLNSLTIVLGDDTESRGLCMKMLRHNPDLRAKTIDMLQDFDFSIRDMKIDEVYINAEMADSMHLSDDAASRRLNWFNTTHAVRDEEKTIVDTTLLDFITQESLGTQKFVETIVPIIDALENGKTVYIDEFASHFHTKLSNSILNLFLSPDNTNNARLILNTHNTGIMSNQSMNRESFVLIDKGIDEQSIITPLADMSVRKDEAFEKRYREGLYGAVPIIREL